MITALDWTLAAAGAPALAASLYLLLLTVLSRREASRPPALPGTRFCILVPAHNEEHGLPATIGSLRAIEYPADLFRIVVVADNCTDHTALVARSHGAHVIIRRDDARRGKGWALQHAIETLLAPDAGIAWDALVVIDADTVVAPNLLREVASHLASGEVAVQAAYLPAPCGDGAIAVITDVAFAAFHVVRSAARERLGLSCGLRGNGMAFSRALLREVPHAAFSKTEDLEFGVQLGLRGVRVAFAGGARVWGDMPERQAVVATQRERWIGGRFAMARRFVPTLLRRAFRDRSPMLADLAADLMTPPLSLLSLASIAGLAASGALALAKGGPTWSGIVWAVAFAGLGLHVVEAARLAGRGRDLVRAAGALPGYALRRAATAVRALRRAEDTWIRTARKGEQR